MNGSQGERRGESCRKRIAGPRVYLRRVESGGASTRYDVRRPGTKGAIGQVTLDLTGKSPVIESLCINEGERGYGAGSETAGALLRGAEPPLPHGAGVGPSRSRARRLFLGAGWGSGR